MRKEGTRPAVPAKPTAEAPGLATKEELLDSWMMRRQMVHVLVLKLAASQLPHCGEKSTPRVPRTIGAVVSSSNKRLKVTPWFSRTLKPSRMFTPADIVAIADKTELGAMGTALAVPDALACGHVLGAVGMPLTGE